jgi:predicted GIY-YIG superfamily endonuclease
MMKKLFSKLEIFKVINSEFIKLEVIKLEVIKPKVIKSKLIKSELIKPELIKSELIKPELIKSELIKPELIKSELIKSELIKPELIKPELIKQELIKSELIKPELIKQELIKSELIKSELIQNLTCYCIINNEKTRTYVGATNKFSRRIRQHNREITGGAKATYGYKWDSIILVEGFKNRSELLSFEWHFKHKKTVHKSGIVRRLESLNLLLKDDRWQHLSIKIISELIDKIDYLNKNILEK